MIRNSLKYWRNFLSSFTHHGAIQIATITVLTGVFTLFFTFSILLQNFNQVLISWGKTAEITVFLKDEITEEETSAIKREFSDETKFSKVNLVTREMARSKFASRLAEYAPDLIKDSELNPFPASLEVQIADVNIISGLPKLAEKLRKKAGVEDVSYGQNWVQGYSSFVAGIRSLGAGLILILLVGSLLVVGNSIRASIFQRQREVEILHLVGATPWDICAPFVFEGAVIGMLSGVVAWLVSFVLYTWASSALDFKVGFTSLVGGFQFLPFWQACFGIVCSTTMGGIGAYICARYISSEKQMLGRGQL